VERLLVVRCPDLLLEREGGREARRFAAVLAVMETFSPLIDVIRPGVAALAVRGPSRYFGGDTALARRLVDAVRSTVGSEETGRTVAAAGVGVADGLFAALLAASIATTDSGDTDHVLIGHIVDGGDPDGDRTRPGPIVVPPGGTATFLAPWPVTVLDRPELTDLLIRLGVGTLGRFAALPTRHVLSRFGTEGATCHRVARGVVGDLPGLRLPTSPISTPGAETGDATAARQPGFWGGSAAADSRAAHVCTQVERILGPGTVLFGRIQGGRSPGERARLVPWEGRVPDRAVIGRRDDTTGGAGTNDTAGSAGTNDTAGSAGTNDTAGAHQTRTPPWPGRLPAPAPVLVFRPPLPAQVTDDATRRVGVDSRGTASAAPARLSVDGGPSEPVDRWAGPWPADERWWATRRRRRARMQIVTTSGRAHLLTLERGRWWLEGTYD
jgi:protein ImuB